MYHVAGYSPRDGINDAVPGIKALLAEIGKRQATLGFEDGIYHIGSDLLLQANIKLAFDGACLSVSQNADVQMRCKQIFDVSWFGANGTSASTTGTIEAGSNQLTVVAGSFFYVGNPLAIHGAGANGEILFSRVLANNGSGLITLSEDAQTAVVDEVVTPADCVAFNEMLSCYAGADWFGSFSFTPGTYQVYSTIEMKRNSSLAGTHRSTCRLVQKLENVILKTEGNVNLANLFLHGETNGKCIESALPVINDCVFDRVWLYGNGSTTGPAIFGNITNTVVTSPVFENFGLALDMPDSRRFNMSNVTFHNVLNVGGVNGGFAASVSV